MKIRKNYTTALLLVVITLISCKKNGDVDEVSDEELVWYSFHGNNQRTGYVDRMPQTNNLLQPKWTYTGIGSKGFNGGFAIDSRHIYFPDELGELRAIKRESGQLEWSYNLSSISGAGLRRTPSIDNKNLYIGAYQIVYAFDKKNGEILWQYQTAEDNYFGNTVVDDKFVYVACNKTIYAIGKFDGKEKWHFTVQDYINTPSIDDATIYFGSYDNYVYALNKNDGSFRWKFATGGKIYTSPAISDSLLYIGSADKKMYALNKKSGTKKWEYITGNEIHSTACVDQESVYFGSFDNKLYSLNKSSGNFIWNYDLKNYVFDALAVDNQLIYYCNLGDGIQMLNKSDGSWVWGMGWAQGVYNREGLAIDKDGLFTGGAGNKAIRAFIN